MGDWVVHIRSSLMISANVAATRSLSATSLALATTRAPGAADSISAFAPAQAEQHSMRYTAAATQQEADTHCRAQPCVVP